MTNLRALCAWVIRWHVTCMLSLAEHWQGRRALSNHVCAHSVISMWHVVCLQHLVRACSEQSRSTTVLPINHVIQMAQCLSGLVNRDYCLWTAVLFRVVAKPMMTWHHLCKYVTTITATTTTTAMQINIFWHKANDIDIFLHKYQSSSEATHFKCAIIERLLRP